MGNDISFPGTLDTLIKDLMEDLTMASFFAFFNEFVSYVILMAILAVLAVVGVKIGSTLRKKKNAKEGIE